jgi:hypothetical protein
MDLFRYADAVAAFAGFKMRNRTFAQFYGRRAQFVVNLDSLMLLVWDDVMPPAERRPNKQNKAHDADGPVSDKPRSGKSDTECEDHGPETPGRHRDMRFVSLFSCFPGIKFYRHIVLFMDFAVIGL